MNDIWNNISSTEEGKAKYDKTLKEVLSNKQFLARIMKRFVFEFSEYSIEDIENKYIEAESVSVSRTGVERNRTNIEGISNEDATLNEGRIFYDIIFKACYPGQYGKYIGLYINVEAQNAYNKGYPVEMRGMYYAARRLSSQLKSINNETNYGCLQKVYSIWVCMGDVPNKEASTATLYRMAKHDIIGSVKRVPEDYDLINVIILRINDQTKTEDEVLGLLQTLCSNLIKKEEKLVLLKQYGIRVKDIEEGVNLMCNLSDLVEARGEAKAKAEVADNLLKDGLPYEKVSEYTGISIDTLRDRMKEAEVSE